MWLIWYVWPWMPALASSSCHGTCPPLSSCSWYDKWLHIHCFLLFFYCPMILSPNSGVVQLTENHKPTSRKLLPTFPPAQVATPVELYFHTCSEYSALSNDHTRKVAERISDTTSSASQCKPGHDRRSKLSPLRSKPSLQRLRPLPPLNNKTCFYNFIVYMWLTELMLYNRRWPLAVSLLKPPLSLLILLLHLLLRFFYSWLPSYGQVTFSGNKIRGENVKSWIKIQWYNWTHTSLLWWLLQCGHPWPWIQNLTQSWLTLNMCVAVKWYAFVLANSGNTATDWVFSLNPDANKTSIVLEQLCLPARMCIVLLYPCLWRTMPQYVPTMDFNLPDSTFPAMWSWSLCEWHVLDPDINNHSICFEDANLQNTIALWVISPTISKNNEENVLDHLGNMTKLAQRPWILPKRIQDDDLMAASLCISSMVSLHIDTLFEEDGLKRVSYIIGHMLMLKATMLWLDFLTLNALPLVSFVQASVLAKLIPPVRYCSLTSFT